MEAKKTKFEEKIVKYYKDIDSAEEKAAKIQRKASCLLKIARSNTENEILKAEECLVSAKEEYEKSIINHGDAHIDDDRYVNRLIENKNRITDCETNLEVQKKQLAFLKELLKEVSE